MKALCVDFICTRNDFDYIDLSSLAALRGSTYTFENEITVIVAITKITKN